MLKRLSAALAAFFVLANLAHGAGTVPGFSLTPQFDLSGKVAPGCKLYVIQAGTVSTPQNPYQDSGLTILSQNPLTCDAAGRLPQWFVADGNIKVRLTTSTGVQIFVGDQLLVIGASSGGGGGSPVDPTTVLATGDFKLQYNTGPISGFVRCNGRTIGSATSGATERANADTSALFSFLYTADPNLAVSGGRGANAAADFAANKTLTLPDCRGRGLAGLDDMGNSAAGRLTATYFGTSATVLGAAGGSQNQSLAANQIPSLTSINASQPISVTSANKLLDSNTGTLLDFNPVSSTGFRTPDNTASIRLQTSSANNSISVAYTNNSPAAVATIGPHLLMTIFIKL